MTTKYTTLQFDKLHRYATQQHYSTLQLNRTRRLCNTTEICNTTATQDCKIMQHYNTTARQDYIIKINKTAILQN